MRSELQDFFQHGDMVLRLRHRQPFVALGPPSSWPDRRRVAKKHKKRRSWKNEKNAKLPLLLWKKRWSFGISRSSQLSCNLGFAPGSKVEKICGSAEVDDSHGFMADLTPLCSLHSKLATKVTKWDPDLLTSTTSSTTTRRRRRA